VGRGGGNMSVFLGEGGLLVVGGWTQENRHVTPTTPHTVLLFEAACQRQQGTARSSQTNMSVFLGEGGLLVVGGWTGDRVPGALRGEGGANDGAEQ
jgi:hypothetical protein